MASYYKCTCEKCGHENITSMMSFKYTCDVCGVDITEEGKESVIINEQGELGRIMHQFMLCDSCIEKVKMALAIK